MGKLYVILLTISLVGVSCEEKQLDEKLTGCYFQCEYVNYAWGFSHSGFTITPAGEIFTFDKLTPWTFAENGKLTFSSLQKNIDASVKRDTLISEADIELYTQLAGFAKSGKLSEPVSRGADIGEHIYKMIIPDSGSKDGYQEVLLTQEGDFDQYNLSPEAAVIAEWLVNLRFH